MTFARYWRVTTASLKPCRFTRSKMWPRHGLFTIATIGLGRLIVSGRRRLPSPPAITTAFTFAIVGAASVPSGSAPHAAATVAREQGDGDGELDGADHGLQPRVPRRSLERDHACELQHRGDDAQRAREEGDEDDPEDPAPPPHDAGDEDGEQRGDRREERERGDAVRGVDLGRGDEDRCEGDPYPAEEREDEDLRAGQE